MPRDQSPAAMVASAWEGRRDAAHDDERFYGWGLMGQPFSSGHVLALRCFPRSSIGPGYVAVWHRDPEGVWRFYSDAPSAESCARYFGPSIDAAEQQAIRVHWSTPWILVVEIPVIGLRWVSEFDASKRARILNTMSSVLPESWFWSPRTLRLLGAVAGGLLGLGRLRLTGSTPSGQWYRASPRRLWAVRYCEASLDGTDLGVASPLGSQARIGEFWVPQRGVLAIGAARFERFDPARHLWKGDAAAGGLGPQCGSR